MEELRRLSGQFNVSQDETNDQGLEVRIYFMFSLLHWKYVFN